MEKDIPFSTTMSNSSLAEVLPKEIADHLSPQPPTIAAKNTTDESTKSVDYSIEEDYEVSPEEEDYYEEKSDSDILREKFNKIIPPSPDLSIREIRGNA